MTRTNIGPCGCCGETPPTPPTVSQVHFHSVSSSGLCAYILADTSYNPSTQVWTGFWVHYGGTITTVLRVLWSDNSETFVTDTRSATEFLFESSTALRLHAIFASPKEYDDWTYQRKWQYQANYGSRGVSPRDVEYVVEGKRYKARNSFDAPIFFTPTAPSTGLVVGDYVSSELSGTINGDTLLLPLS